MQSVINVDITSFQREVMERSQNMPVVVDFWSPTCGPCMTLGPMLEELARESGGKWVLAKVNTADPQNQQLAADFRIQGIPAVKAIVNGQIVDEFVGALPKENIQEWLRKFVPNEEDAIASAGIAALEGKAFGQALELFTELKRRAPEDDRASLGLAELAILNGDKESAETYFSQIPTLRIKNVKTWHSRVGVLIAGFGKDKLTYEKILEKNPNDLDARFELANLNGAEGQYEKAFEDLIFIVSVNPKFREEAARLAAIRLFEVVGVNSPLATEWRKKLGRAMY